MKVNNTMSLCYAMLCLLLTAACTASAQTIHAQVPAASQGPVRLPLTRFHEALRKRYLLNRAAAASLHAGNYAQAEAQARQAMSPDFMPSEGNEVLAAALDAQGKDEAALQIYCVMVVDQKGSQPSELLPYALLLLKSGQWTQSLAFYNQALPHLGDGKFMQADNHFSPTEPEPAALTVALHIALGLMYNANCNVAGESQDKEAMAEYKKALQLAPNSALANYYYGYGWQRLDPKDRAKMSSLEQVKAALKKAVKFGDPNIRYATTQTLQAIAENH